MFLGVYLSPRPRRSPHFNQLLSCRRSGGPAAALQGSLHLRRLKRSDRKWCCRRTRCSPSLWKQNLGDLTSCSTSVSLSCWVSIHTFVSLLIVSSGQSNCLSYFNHAYTKNIWLDEKCSAEVWAFIFLIYSKCLTLFTFFSPKTLKSL